MIPSKLDITFWRGAPFELELVAQVKVYVYDPAVHNTPADLKRTHQENLEFHGFTYQYVDFAADYADAELRIMRPWKSGQTDGQPLMTLSKTDYELSFTNKSVKISVDSLSTKAIEFDSGVYELLLVKSNSKKDGLTYGSVTILGDR